MCDDVWIYKISILEWVYKQTYSWGGPRCRKASIAAISCYFSGPCQKWFHTVDISTINPTWAYNIFFWVPKKGKVIIHCSFCFMDLLMSEPFFQLLARHQTLNYQMNSNEWLSIANAGHWRATAWPTGSYIFMGPSALIRPQKPGFLEQN